MELVELTEQVEFLASGTSGVSEAMVLAEFQEHLGFLVHLEPAEHRTSGINNFGVNGTSGTSGASGTSGTSG